MRDFDGGGAVEEEIMEIIEKKLSEITPYENNPRKNDDAVEYVANSIREFGWKVPIVIDRDGVIIAGHTRYKAAQKLGYETVPCIMADDLTPEQVKAYRLADNKVSEFAEWDFDLLAAELDEIDLDMSEFGFLDEEEDQPEVQEDEFDEEPQEEPKAKRGQIYQLGRHRLMCGDSTVSEDVKNLMNGEKADMVFTDPPYGVSYTGGAKIENGKIESNDRTEIANDALDYNGLYSFLLSAFENARNSTKDRAAFYVFYAHSRSREFLNAFYGARLKQRSIIIWHKIGGGFGDFMAQYMNAYEPFIYGSNGDAVNWYGATNEKTVWEIEKPTNADLHPTMKPIQLVSRAIKNSSLRDEIVLDLFGGSGSTLMACEQTERVCYMMELDPRYVDVIIDRWERFTGEKAVLLNV